MNGPIDSYLEAVRERLATDDEQTRLILAEIRGHMEEKVADLARDDPNGSRLQHERSVVEDFGDPADLALAYDDAGAMVLRDRKGDILLVLSRDVAEAGRKLGRGVAAFGREARDRTRAFAAGWKTGWDEGRQPIEFEATRDQEYAPGHDPDYDHPDSDRVPPADSPPGPSPATLPRSAAAARRGAAGGRAARRTVQATSTGARGVGTSVGGAFKGLFLGLLILLAAILLSGTLVGIFLFDDIVAVVEANQVEDVADVRQSCDNAPCTTGTVTGSFFVSPDAERVLADMHVHRTGDSNGTAWLKVWDPTGKLVYDSTFTDPHQTRSNERLTWAPLAGQWSYSYAMDDFQGHLELDAWVRGI